jgi:hypothetical protein
MCNAFVGMVGIVVLFKQNIILFMFTILLSTWPYIAQNFQACLFSRKVVICIVQALGLNHKARDCCLCEGVSLLAFFFFFAILVLVLLLLLLLFALSYYWSHCYLPFFQSLGNGLVASPHGVMNLFTSFTSLILVI